MHQKPSGGGAGCLLFLDSGFGDFLGGGNSNMFVIFTPKIGEDEPNLTIIFFKGLVQPPTSIKIN